MFWSSQEIDKQQQLAPLIVPFDANAIKQGSYELSMGAQAAISRASPKNAIIELGSKEILQIPPGQFGLLLTEEIVNIPTNVVAFISLKTTIKSQGLINVSGFHVDPGYSGRLKFWVYNGGNKPIRVQRGGRTFLIWFSKFDKKVRDPYPNSNPSDQNEITMKDLGQLEGHIASPAALAQQIQLIQGQLKHYIWLTRTLATVVAGLSFALAGPLFSQLYTLVVSHQQQFTGEQTNNVLNKKNSDLVPQPLSSLGQKEQPSPLNKAKESPSPP